MGKLIYINRGKTGHLEVQVWGSETSRLETQVMIGGSIDLQNSHMDSGGGTDPQNDSHMDSEISIRVRNLVDAYSHMNF